MGPGWVAGVGGVRVGGWGGRWAGCWAVGVWGGWAGGRVVGRAVGGPRSVVGGLGGLGGDGVGFWLLHYSSSINLTEH